MKSLILTTLYLFKDTIYRWKDRPSSAMSRVLVVFFLSLCALMFLANYVVSKKILDEKLKRNGADLIVFIDYEMSGSLSNLNLIREGLPKLIDVDLLVFSDSGIRGRIGERFFPIVEYGDEGLGHLKKFPLDRFPYLALLPADSEIPVGPATVVVDSYTFDLVAREIPPGHMISKAYKEGVILVPSGVLFNSGVDIKTPLKRYVARVRKMSYENVKFVDQLFTNILRLGGSMGNVLSAAPILADLEIIESNQKETRAGFSIGIAVIVGILLTALASMEFRENEYIYTLMKSFGVRPFLLVATFVVENLFLVGISFFAALFFFMEVKTIILREFFKLEENILTLGDLRKDIFLLTASLVICVFVSAIPIAMSAYREIGRVLK